MKKRFQRLYPLHITCTLIVFAIIFYRTSALHDAAYAIRTLALHISLLWAFVPELGHSLNQPSWALSVFFLCYALTPAFSRFLNRQGKKELWLFLLGLFAILFFLVASFEEFPRVLSGINFFSGMLLGKLFSNNAIFLPKKSLHNDLFLLFALALLYINVCYFMQINSQFASYIVSPIIYSVLLLLLANNKGFIVKIISMPWIRNVGKASFYTYLLHIVVIQFLHLYLDKVTHWKYNTFDKPLATVIIMILLYGSCVIYGSCGKKHCSVS